MSNMHGICALLRVAELDFVYLPYGCLAWLSELNS